MLASAFLPDGTVVCMWSENGMQCTGCGITRSFRHILGLDPKAIVTIAGKSVFGFIIVQVVLRSMSWMLVSDREGIPTILLLDAMLSAISLLLGFWWVLA